ncbi:MAG: PAS domain-containing protein [Pseudomonadota bacterium]
MFLTRKKAGWFNLGEEKADGVILKLMNLAFMAVDRECKIILFNPSAEELTGRSRSQVIGKYCAAVLKGNLCRSVCPLKECLQTGVTCRRGVVMIESVKKQPIAVEITASVLRGKDGGVLGAVGVLHDISEPWHLRKAHVEMDAIYTALARHRGNISETAKELQMHRTTLWRKIKRYRIHNAGGRRQFSVKHCLS